MKSRLRLHLSLSFACVALCALGANAQQPPSGIRVEKNVAAAMRDGVVLRADVYRPATPGSYPALLQRTPYSKNDQGAARRFSAIAARGYVVVVQDTRGRYTSDGVAIPHDEADDGYDSVAVGVEAAGGQRQGRDVRRQLSRHHAARWRRRCSPPAPRRAVPAVVVQPPPRHGVSGRRVLSERRPVVEPRTGDRRAPPRCSRRQRIGTARSVSIASRARCSVPSGSGSYRSRRSTSSSSSDSPRVTGRCSSHPDDGSSSGRRSTSNRTTTSFSSPRFISPGGTTRC